MKRDPLLQEREKTHGSFVDVSANASNIKLAYKHSKYSQLSAQHREALDMIATKIARIISGNANVKDHWDDIAGYAKLGAEACE